MYIYNIYSGYVRTKQYGEGGLLSFYKATVELTVIIFYFYFFLSLHTLMHYSIVYSLVWLRSFSSHYGSCVLSVPVHSYHAS